jgi:fumarate hydratase class I
MNKLTLPMTEADVRNLKAGDLISLSGVVVTARDAAHKYMVEQLIAGKAVGEDHDIYTDLRSVLRNGAIYHCGPVMEESDGKWRVIAAGPTTSIREEEYEDQIIEHFGVRAIIGKGGMDHGLLKRVGNTEQYICMLSAVLLRLWPSA